ncbi:MAG: S1 RNA-binding domain-containing protein, partial [Bacteroidota bacterium]
MSDEKDLKNENQEETPETVETTTATEAATEVAEVTNTKNKEEESSPENADDIVDEFLKDNVDPNSAHDDFDWSISNKHTLAYTDDEVAKYLAEYESTLNSVTESEIVKAKVSAITSGDVVLDINFKSDGLISLSEFRDMPELKVGDEVDVYVEQQENEKGQLILSRRKAKLLKAWQNLVDSYQTGSIIKGTVVSKTKGGLIVDAGGLETFLPGSQIDIKPIIDYDSYVGKTMEFKVVKINEAIKNAVVS